MCAPRPQTNMWDLSKPEEALCQRILEWFARRGKCKITWGWVRSDFGKEYL